MPSIYTAWGFRDNPFATAPLQPNDQGVTLLIGRDSELKQLCRRLENGPRLPTIEGGIGVGKTSLVNVAAYKLFKACLKNGEGHLFIPCRKTFQITNSAQIDPLIDSVIYEVAQTLIERASLVELNGLNLGEKNKIDKWLNSPTFTAVEGGLQILGCGASGGTTVSQNTGQGFDKSGLRKIVFQWLREIFPDNKGGVVCVIDNMELLQESSEARRAAEALRDELFSVPGLRWVLCGANGIVQSVLSSPRLQGILYTPIDVQGIDDGLIQEVLDSRRAAFEVSPGKGYLPITPAALDVLYEALNKNLRNLLSFADEFSLWVADKEKSPATDDEKDSAFFEWLDEVTSKAYVAVATQLRPRAWEVFDRAIELGGQFSPSDYQKFGCESLPALRPQVKDLEAAGLLLSIRDDTDQRRKSIEVTSNRDYILDEVAFGAKLRLMNDPQKQIDDLQAKSRDLQAVVLFQGAELKAVRTLVVFVASKCGITHYKGQTLEATLADLIGQQIDQNLATLADDDPSLATVIRKILEIGQDAADERQQWKEEQ